MKEKKYHKPVVLSESNAEMMQEWKLDLIWLELDLGGEFS